MMKYRIVSRNRDYDGYHSIKPYYYAQSKLFGLWVDCRFNPFILGSCLDSYDIELKVVEEWIDDRLRGKEDFKEEVIKTYD